MKASRGSKATKPTVVRPCESPGARWPKGWSEYQRAVRAGRIEADAQWARYAARFRMAVGYRDMRFSGVSPSTVAGYSAALKVFLGYSAFEAACRAAGRDHNAVTFVRPGLGRALRAVGASADHGDFPLANTLKSPTLKSKISTSVRGESEDVVPFAAAIRHLVAHGVFTVHGGKADTNRAVSALWALGDDMLLLSESILGSFLAEKLGRHGSAPVATRAGRAAPLA